MMDKKLEEGLNLLKRNYIDAIMTYLTTGVFSMPQGVTYMQAHTIVWNIGNRDIIKSPTALYNLFKGTLSNYNNNVAIPKIMGKTGKEILNEFSLHWNRYTIMVYWLRKPFQFLEREFLKTKKLPPLCQTALNIFQNEVFEKVISTIVKNLFDELEAERGGELIDWIKMKKTLQCFRVMGITKAEVIKEDSGELSWNGVTNLNYYKKYFEEEYIRQTTDYYDQESKKWITTMSCPEFTRVATESFRKEEEKIERFLDKETRPKLLAQLNEKIVANHAQRLTDMDKTGVTEMLTNKRIEELKALTQLLNRKPETLVFILEKLKPYIISRGKALQDNKELLSDPVKYIKCLVDLKNEMDSLMVESFASMEQFIRINDLAFQEILDTFDLTPKFLAYYIDDLMKQGLRGKEAEMESMIDNVFSLFKLLKAKDAFTEHHKDLYAMRLLHRSSISDAAEELLISKMKIELGTQHVAKYVQMGVDMKNSRDQTDEFKKGEHGGVIQGVELNVKVLTSGLWGGEHNVNCKLPAELAGCCEKFEAFYKQIHTGRHLVWNPGLGDCEIKSHGFAKPYTFVTTVYQATILALFNFQDTYTYKELLESTKLPSEIMVKQMFNLTNPRMGKLLVKANLKTPSFTPDEKITLNKAFASTSLRFSFIPAPAKKKMVEEHRKEYDAELKEINKQRAAILQATIVKIMKGRRQEKHNELIGEVIKLIQSFKPDPTMIKQQIEWLIESDYLMRDEKDKSKYIYKP